MPKNFSICLNFYSWLFNTDLLGLSLSEITLHLNQNPTFSQVVCLCVLLEQDAHGGIVLQGAKTTSSNRRSYKKCPCGTARHKILIFMNGSMESPAASRQNVPHPCAGEAICLSGKTGKCLSGLVGLTVSPVRAVLLLSAFEQMETNLHLISHPPMFPLQFLVKNSIFFSPPFTVPLL